MFLLIELHFIHDPNAHFGNAGTALLTSETERSGVNAVLNAAVFT